MLESLRTSSTTNHFVLIEHGEVSAVIEGTSLIQLILLLLIHFLLLGLLKSHQSLNASLPIFHDAIELGHVALIGVYTVLLHHLCAHRSSVVVQLIVSIVAAVALLPLHVRSSSGLFLPPTLGAIFLNVDHLKVA